MMRFPGIPPACFGLLVITGCHAAGQVMVEAPRAAVYGVTGQLVDTIAAGTQEGRPVEPPTRRRVTGDDVEQIDDLYEECQYERCLAAAEEITDQTAAKSRYRAKAWFYQGVILVLQGNEMQARECFRQARTLDHRLKADRHRFKPAVVQCFESAGR